ncbi:MAG TPA: AAA family ATPase [bacterium]|nr:AAA family ATPase [bacterium]
MDDFETELALLIRARYPIIYLVSWEERRVERIVRRLATSLGKHVIVWTSSAGFDQTAGRTSDSTKPFSALSHVLQVPEKSIFLLKDFHPFLNEREPVVTRMLRDIGAKLKTSYKTVIILSPVLNIPVELEKEISVLDVPLPTEQELRGILDSVVKQARRDPRLTVDISDDVVDKMVRATCGLTEEEAENAFAKALVNDGKFTEDDLPMIIREKKQIIRKTGVLEYYDLSETFDAVGGLSKLKLWLTNRAEAFGAEAREFGLPEPKGLLLVGVQGCGKSLTAKAVASLWKLPLLRLDVGSLFGSYIGTSEHNMRKAIKVAESLAPAILWLDEIEKGFSGVMGSGSTDGGTTARVFATFLTWLQEKTKPVFVVATANAINQLPPEMLRKGRFDEIFFIDLPTEQERESIIKIHLKKRKRDPTRFAVAELARGCAGGSGAEIEQAIISALYEAFAEKRDISTQDVLRAFSESVPLSAMMREQIAAFRAWAKDRARPAS